MKDGKMERQEVNGTEGDEAWERRQVKARDDGEGKKGMGVRIVAMNMRGSSGKDKKGVVANYCYFLRRREIKRVTS